MEDAQELVRAAAQVQHPRRHPVGLDADTDERGAPQLGDQREVVAAFTGAERPELVAEDDHVLRAASAVVDQRLEHVPHAVALVGEPYHDVLDVTGNAGMGEAHVARKSASHLDHLADAADPGAREPRGHAFLQFGEPR